MEYSEKETEELQATYKHLIDRRNSTSMIWGIKDPRLCILLPVLLPLLDDPIILHIVRDWDASVKSLQKREKWDRSKAKKVFSLYTKAKNKSLIFAESCDVPIWSMHFENLADYPKATILEFLPQVFARWDEGLWPSPFLINHAAAHVNKEYIHHD